MPTIMFWNVRGSGGDTIKSSAGDILLGELSHLTSEEKPDLVVLCELREGFESRFDGLGRGYMMLNLPANYPKSTTYRFGAFLRLSGKCTITQPPQLINDGNNRPALSLVINQNVGMLAVHAPSVSGSISAQMRHIQNTVQQCRQERVPKIILGDFNMDLLTQRHDIASALQAARVPLSNYWLRPLPQHTKATHNLGKALDWALVEPNFNTSYWIATGLEKSDHQPIFISWR